MIQAGMTGLFSTLAVGFFLGMRHATDPDHVVAVTTIVSRQRSMARAAATGVIWGVGHTITIFAVGAAIILFELVIPARVGLSMEFSVGLMLIVLGAANVRAFLRALPGASGAAGGGGSADGLVHSHAHSHGDYVHTHPHEHGPEQHGHASESTPLARLDRALGGLGLYNALRPLLVGIIHGLAGSAAVALLVLATIRSAQWAIFYLLLFGLGTIAGMMLITMSLASAFHLVSRNRERFAHALGFASGLVSLAFGCYLAYHIGFVDGLLNAHPQWTPH
jgi:high-affinity nickel-transport protein